LGAFPTEEIRHVLASEADIIYNWRNELRQNTQGERTVAAQSAIDFQKRGFTAQEALEMLAAENFDLRIAEHAVYTVYGKTASAESSQPVRTAMVVPTSYSDVKPIIEDTLRRLSAKEFVDRLAKSESPIVRVSQKNLESWYRLAANAKQDAFALDVLHSELKPWVEETMLKSVLIAEREEARIQKLAKNERRYKVAMRKEAAEVDLDQGTSTGTRFQKGHFADFGLADEFMIQAADHVSPYERLKRALGN
jgi:hypothetical protein